MAGTEICKNEILISQNATLLFGFQKNWYICTGKGCADRFGRLNNPDFNVTEFGNIRNEAGSNGFVLTVKQWVERTGAIGIISTPGRYGGTYAHRDIALEFASWLSAELKYYMVRELQRLKADENDRLQLNWTLQRTLSERLTQLNQIARTQMQSLLDNAALKQLSELPGADDLPQLCD